MEAAGKGGGEGKNRSAQVSGLSRCRGEGTGAVKLGGEFGCGGSFLPSQCPTFIYKSFFFDL